MAGPESPINTLLIVIDFIYNVSNILNDISDPKSKHGGQAGGIRVCKIKCYVCSLPFLCPVTSCRRKRDNSLHHISKIIKLLKIKAVAYSKQAKKVGARLKNSPLWKTTYSYPFDYITNKIRPRSFCVI